MRHVSRKLIVLIPLLAAGFVFWYFRKVFFDAEYFLPRDNASLHFPTFQAISAHLRYLGHFPDWLYPAGVPLRWLANNAIVMLPHKALGYLLAWQTDISFNVLYKVLLVFVGIGSFLVGIYFLAKRLFEERTYAWLSVAIAATSSVTMVVLHQEQTLGTIFYVPFLWLLWFRAVENPRWLPAFAGLFGVAMNNHYPQILVIYVLLIFVASFFAKKTRGVTLDVLKGLLRSPRFVFHATVAFTIGALPILNTYFSEQHRLVSPHRGQTVGIAARTFEEYREMNLLQMASVWPSDFKLYGANPAAKPSRLADLDDFIFYMGPWLLLWILLFFSFGSQRGFHVLAIGGLTLLSAGIYGPLPQILWHFVPGVKLFRQYYYFLPLLNLHLLYISVAALKVGRTIDFSLERARWGSFGISAALLVFCLFGILPPNRWIPGTLLLAAVCWKPSLKATSFLALVGLGLLHQGAWTIESLKGIQARMVNASFEPATVRSASDFGKLFTAAPPINPMVAPKSSELTDFVRTNQQGLFFWENAKGEIARVRPEELDIRFDSGVFRVLYREIPAGITNLVWAQWNDSRWRTFPKTLDGSILRWKVKEGSGVAISRRRFPWHRSVFFTWLCIAAMGVFGWYRRHERWGMP